MNHRMTPAVAIQGAFHQAHALPACSRPNASSPRLDGARYQGSETPRMTFLLHELRHNWPTIAGAPQGPRSGQTEQSTFEDVTDDFHGSRRGGVEAGR